MPNVIVNPQLHNNEGFVCDAAEFDGTVYLVRGGDLTGVVNGKKGIFTAYFKIASAVQDKQLMSGVGVISTFLVEFFFTTLKFSLSARNAALEPVLNLQSGALTTGTWYRLLASWDLAVPGARHLYITDALDMTVVTFVDDTIDYTNDEWSICADQYGSGPFAGGLAELYFNAVEYLDFSVEDNRRKFSGADGKPCYLGLDGSVPTGNAPLVYLHLDPDEAPANFAVNRGTGGNFVVTAGTLTTATTSPSD